jgi:putative drug exporter of the RND superfamily
MPINPFLPLMMFAILFGLSMDYEVYTSTPHSYAWRSLLQR